MTYRLVYQSTNARHGTATATPATMPFSTANTPTTPAIPMRPTSSCAAVLVTGGSDG